MQVFEILNDVDKLDSRAAKIEELKKYSEHTPFKYVIKMNYCDTIKSLIPEGEPPYNKDEQDGPSRSSLWSYLKTFPMFVVSTQAENMRALQREQLYIEMLEAIDNEEAVVMNLAKDKKLQTVYSIDVGMVQQAFPDLEISTSEVVAEPSDEEKADDLLALAKLKEQTIKSLRAEVTQLKKDAKSLVANDE